MDSEEFAIGFSFKGRDYSGIVITNERAGSSTFVVRYSMEPARQFEKTVEITPVSGEETDHVEWEEVVDEVGEKMSDSSLIQVIGEAVEDREV
jgi:hypothetical protein